MTISVVLFLAGGLLTTIHPAFGVFFLAGGFGLLMSILGGTTMAGIHSQPVENHYHENHFHENHEHNYTFFLGGTPKKTSPAVAPIHTDIEMGKRKILV
jgi:hypothetical protein